LWLNRSELTHVEHQLPFWRINSGHHTTLYILSRRTGQAGKRNKMVNESMSLEELTGRAYARGLPAVKVRFPFSHKVGLS